MTTALSTEARVQELEVALAVPLTQLRSATRALEVEQAAPHDSKTTSTIRKPSGL